MKNFLHIRLNLNRQVPKLINLNQLTSAHPGPKLSDLLQVVPRHDPKRHRVEAHG